MTKSQQIHVAAKKRSGYATLISIMVISAVGIAATLSIILFGLNSSETTYNYRLMQQARMLAVSCSEEALEQLRQDKFYNGSESITLGIGTCTYTVSAFGDENRVIQAYGVVGGVVRKVEVYVSAINPYIVISSIRDVSNFCVGDGCSDNIVLTGSGASGSGS